MSETAEGEDVGGGGFVAEEEAMRKRHKKESGVSIVILSVDVLCSFRKIKSLKLLIKPKDIS